MSTTGRIPTTIYHHPSYLPLVYHSQPLSRATGAVQNGLQETTVDSTEALKTIVSEALASVSSASIRGFYKLALHAIDAYPAGVQYGTEEFKQKVYKYIYPISR